MSQPQIGSPFPYTIIPTLKIPEQEWEGVLRSSSRWVKLTDHDNGLVLPRRVVLRTLMALSGASVESMVYDVAKKHTGDQISLILGIKAAIGMIMSFIERYYLESGCEDMVTLLGVLRASQFMGQKESDVNPEMMSDIVQAATAYLVSMGEITHQEYQE